MAVVPFQAYPSALRWSQSRVRNHQNHPTRQTIARELSGRPGVGEDLVGLPFLPTSTSTLPVHVCYRLASTIFQTFVASDNSSETFASLKRIHGLIPYFLLKAALKISNPVAMIRNVLDIFLAQPFGGRSLLQRYVSRFQPLLPSCKCLVACSPLPLLKKSDP